MSSGRVLYFDLVGGAAGDMLLAALIDLGASIDRVREAWRMLGLDVRADLEEARPAGLRARRLRLFIQGREADSAPPEREPELRVVRVGKGGLLRQSGRPTGPTGKGGDPNPSGELHRPYRVIRAMIEAAALPGRVRAIALDAFRRLAEAEGQVHGTPVEEVEFHEVGSDDAIADIVGVAAAVAELDPAEISASPVPIGRGLIQGAHGPIPLPGPATLEILKGAPLEGVLLEGETITPTGAALLMALATRFGPAPAMILEATGVGAGRKTWPDRPNIVRALIGRSAVISAEIQEDCVVEANLDDMSPVHLGALERALFQAGAHDVWWMPASMKKERSGLVVSALVRRNLAQALAAAFFIHSTTLGVRIHPVSRIRADRTMDEVETRFGKVRIKIAERPLGPPLVAPEYDDCARLAESFGVPLREVIEEALRAAWSKRNPP